MGLHVLEFSKANYKGNVKIKAVISNSAYSCVLRYQTSGNSSMFLSELQLHLPTKPFACINKYIESF
jgi:hypothetical protein